MFSPNTGVPYKENSGYLGHIWGSEAYVLRLMLLVLLEDEHPGAAKNM